MEKTAWHPAQQNTTASATIAPVESFWRQRAQASAGLDAFSSI